MARILVVNDDPNVSGMLEAVLAMAEHDVTMAHTGTEALARLRAHPYDVMVLDVGLHGLCGYELLEIARDLPDRARMPVIAITSEAEAPFPAAARLSKPLQVDALLATIEQASANGPPNGPQGGTGTNLTTRALNHPSGPWQS